MALSKNVEAVLRRKYAPDFALYDSIKTDGHYTPVAVPSPING